MPSSFPKPGTFTLCEINRDFITSDVISDHNTANNTYAKLLGGKVFSPVQFQSEQVFSCPPPEDANAAGSNSHSETTTTTTTTTTTKPAFIATFQGLPIFQPTKHVVVLNLLPEVHLQGVSWHQHKHILAFISAPNQVTVCDFDDSEGKDPCILTAESQRCVKLVEWRPNGGKTLSVACKGGICIWEASYPGNAASVRSGVASFSGTLSWGSGIRWTPVDFLRSINDEQITALSWSPNGRYLASASYESSSFTVWDVAQGMGTPIRRGLGGISMLKWSPTGDYFFSAKFDGTFYLWETSTWTSEPWSLTGGFVTGAIWDPEGRMILISFSKSSTLGSIHFASKPPSLDAHLLPVDLPEMITLTGSQGIEKIAWDASGERLAISYKGGDELYKGLIAIYDTKRTPLISASLIGFIRGPGEHSKPITFSFHNKFKQGPLLSVCWSSGVCCTYPLIFRSHIAP